MSAIDGHTLVHGIIGNPVGHSLSPAMHNAAFAALGMNRVYVPFPVEDLPSAISGIRGLSLAGLSVTIPHKEAIIPLLDEVEEVAADIGAVNTVVVGDDGRLVGHNTDWLGASRALAGAMELGGSRVVMIGAGGAARAVGFGLKKAGAELVLVNRDRGRGEALAADLACGFVPLKKLETVGGDALVNATSIGMAPDLARLPISSASLKEYAAVMDIVYAPLKTELLREAADCGCRVVNGLEMLLLQGAAQFELWTGVEAPLAVMRRVLAARFEPSEDDK